MSLTNQWTGDGYVLRSPSVRRTIQFYQSHIPPVITDLIELVLVKDQCKAGNSRFGLVSGSNQTKPLLSFFQGWTNQTTMVLVD